MSARRSSTTLNVVHSSGWLEYLADASNAEFFALAIEAPDRLIVPSLSILEVFKWILRERGENQALPFYLTQISVSAARSYGCAA